MSYPIKQTFLDNLPKLLLEKIRIYSLSGSISNQVINDISQGNYPDLHENTYLLTINNPIRRDYQVIYDIYHHRYSLASRGLNIKHASNGIDLYNKRAYFYWKQIL